MTFTSQGPSIGGCKVVAQVVQVAWGGGVLPTGVRAQMGEILDRFYVGASVVRSGIDTAGRCARGLVCASLCTLR
jgi:hypothetical protein